MENELSNKHNGTPMFFKAKVQEVVIQITVQNNWNTKHNKLSNDQYTL